MAYISMIVIGFLMACIGTVGYLTSNQLVKDKLYPPMTQIQIYDEKGNWIKTIFDQGNDQKFWAKYRIVKKDSIEVKP